jgi:hypothetical protein
VDGIAGMIFAGAVALAGGLGGSMLIATLYVRRHGDRQGVEGPGVPARTTAALEFVRAYDDLAYLAAPGVGYRARSTDSHGQQERLDEAVEHLSRSAITLRLLCTEEAYRAVEDAAQLCEQVAQALSGRATRAAAPRIEETAAALQAHRHGLFAVLRAEIARA